LLLAWPAGRRDAELLAERLLHLIEMGGQAIDTKRSREVRLVAPREQFGHVAEVAQAVADGRWDAIRAHVTADVQRTARLAEKLGLLKMSAVAL
jgi:hypothetical protein